MLIRFHGEVTVHCISLHGFYRDPYILVNWRRAKWASARMAFQGPFKPTQKTPRFLENYIRESWPILLFNREAIFKHLVDSFEYLQCKGLEEKCSYYIKDSLEMAFKDIKNSSVSIGFPVYMYFIGCVLKNDKKTFSFSESKVLNLLEKFLLIFQNFFVENPDKAAETITHFAKSMFLKEKDMKMFSQICLTILRFAIFNLQLYKKDHFLLIAVSHMVMSGTYGQPFADKLSGVADSIENWNESQIEGLTSALKFQSKLNVCAFPPRYLCSIIKESVPTIKLDDLRMIVEHLPVPLVGEWKSFFICSFLFPLSEEFALHGKQENDFSVIAKKRWTGVTTEVYHLLVAAQKFITDNNCSESLSGSSSTWLMLVPQAIQFEDLRPSHVKEMTYLFDDTIFVKRCKAEIYDMFFKMIQENYAAIEPNSFVALVELLEVHQQMKSSVIETYLQCFDGKYPLNDYGAVILKLHERDAGKTVHTAQTFFERASSVLNVNGDVLPLMYSYMLSFDLDKLLDVPEAETMLLKFLNTLIKNISLLKLTKQLKQMMGKPTLLEPNRFQNLVCMVLLKNLSSNNENWITDDVIDKAYELLDGAETKFVENSPGFQFICGILSKICLWIANSNDLDDWRQIIKNSQIPLLVRAIKPIFDHCTKSELSDVRGCVKFFKRVQETFTILERDIKAKKVSLYFVKLLNTKQKQEKIREMCEVLGNSNNITESLSKVMIEYQEITKKLEQLLVVRHQTDHGYYIINTLINVLKPYEMFLPLELLSNLGDMYDIEGARENVVAKNIIPMSVVADENSINILKFFRVYKQLESFLGPLKTNFTYLICFDNLKNKFIKMLMVKKYFQFKSKTRTTATLHEAIQYCIEKVKCAFLDGSICLNDMNLDVDSENEMKNLKKFVEREFKSNNNLIGWKGFVALNSMSHFQRLIPDLSELFLQFELKNCLSSDTFEILLNYCQQLENPASVSFLKAVEMKNAFHRLFPFSTERCKELQQLFEELKLADKYVNFCKENKFYGEDGKRLFLTKYNFILQEIHDLAEQHAVDALWMAYNTIFLFIDENVEFQSFTRNLQSLGNIRKIISQLIALRLQNLELLKECFTRDESESQKNVSKRLDEIFQNHYVQYDLGGSVEMKVVRTIEGIDTPWDSKDILEFSSRLEIMKLDLEVIEDDDGEFYEKIKEFDEINRIANEACDILRKLKQIGHFEYQNWDKSVYKFPFNSSHGIPIGKMKSDLDSWKVETIEKRLKHPVLSLFSNFKILRLYDLMVDHNGPLLVHELIGCMMFAVNGIDLESAKAIKNIVNTLKFDKYLSGDHFESVGLFLTDFRQMFEGQISRSTALHPATPMETIFRLYMVENPTSFNIYASTMMLLNYNPLSFQVLHCSSLTTVEIIVLFFSQMEHNHKYSYVILEVNKLSNTLQEVIINECLRLQDVERSRGTQFDISFVESGPSLLRTMPWCYQEYIKPDFQLCGKQYVTCHLVYGLAGNGKTHYIQNQMKLADKKTITISVNEDFQYMLPEFISRMSVLSSGTPNILVYVNFTLPYFTKEFCLNTTEIEFMEETCTLVNWFFFSLLILGYIEDPNSSISFSLNQVNTMEVFVEVPVINNDDVEIQLEVFNNHFPIFKFVGKESLVPSKEDTFICENDNEKLVGQYLKAKEDNKLDKLHKKGWFSWFCDDKGVSLKDYNVTLSDQECSNLIMENIPPKIKERRIYQKLFVSYLACRCQFLEESVFLRTYKGRIDEVDSGSIWSWFTASPKLRQQDEYCDQKKLRSLLLQLMKEEVREICIPLKGTGFSPPHLQLIYVHKDKNFTFLHNGVVQMSEEEEKIIRTFKFHLPSRNALRNRNELENYLYSALQIPEGTKSILKETGYIVTLDYLQKMLSVHERLKSGMPVIISGETGVGKTFLFETLSKLYSEAHIESFQLWKKEFAKTHLKNSKCIDDVQNLSANDTSLAKQQMLSDEVTVKIESYLPFLEESLLFRPEEFNDSEMKYFLSQFMFGDVKQLFYVLKVHPGLKPSDIRDFIKPIIKKETDREHAPDCKVLVFFDEINTSSCLGFLKEIVIDHSMDGITLPSSLFIVAACNPMRANSVAVNDTVITDADSEQWFKGNYVVHQMMPSFSLLTWDFGSLNESQEEDYILAKLAIMDSSLNAIDVEVLKDKIALSQRLVRQFTEDYITISLAELKQHKLISEVKTASSSAVSQRDIQKVLKLYTWFKQSYKTLCKFPEFNYAQRWGESEKDVSMRSLYLSLALVYYFRLNKVYRERYAEEMSNDIRYNFLDILNSELKWFMDNMSIPPGIANTQALRENVYAMVICIMNCIPLIITGPPGTSKTLSFKIVQANMRGDVSPMPLFCNTELFNLITSHTYQCSKHSTPSDIDEVFEKAKKMKMQILESGQNGTSVVFLDEAGLPDDNLQVLKVLHYHLENPEVSFIALTNRVLDAAKSNRAICLFQVNTSEKDINRLAQANVSLNQGKINDDDAIWTQLSQISSVFYKEMLRTEFNSMFGLRDIMHLFSFIRRNLTGSYIQPETLVKAIQRNFSGTENFDTIAKRFLSELIHQETLLKKKYPSSVAILRDSLLDKPEDLSFENEVRHKLLIDYSEDGSLILNLFKFGILDRAETKVFSSSHLRRDRMRKTLYLTKIRNSVTRGHMIVLDQFNDIYESLYDLFNQRYTCIGDKNTKHMYYTRIAIGSRFSNCFVNPSFQCIVILKKSALPDTPAPFLNRFEKFDFSHQSFLDELLKFNSPFVKLLLKAMETVDEFIEDIPSPGVFGQEKHTLLSLALTHIAVPHNEANPTPSLLATPCGEPIFDVFTKFVDYKESVIQNFDEETLFIFEDIQYAIETAISDETFSIKRPIIEETFHSMKKMEGNIDDSETIVSKRVNQMFLILLQYLVIRLTKEIMQLLPPEVFVAIKENIPSYYTHVYLNHQAHYSLKDLLSHLPSDFTESKMNKTFCYCRYSTLMIPRMYFPLDKEEGFKTSEWMKLKTILPENMTNNHNAVCSLEIHPDLHGDYLYRKIKHFLEVDSYTLLLLCASPKLIQKETINYTRLVIEELEFEKQTYKKICFLLMFPSELFFDHFYPSYYLDGWNHYYLDSLVPSTKIGSLNLKSCFQFSLADNDIDGAILFEDLYTAEIPIVCTSFISAPFYNRKYGDLTALSSLLSPEGDFSIGKSLFQKFCSQWSPKKMEHILNQATSSSLTHSCKISMTDAVDMLVKFSFHDFMSYMLAFLTKHGALAALLDDNRCAVFLDFIRYQIKTHSLPDTSAQMQLEIASLQNPSTETLTFPFFQQIYDMIELSLQSIKSKQIGNVTEHTIEKWVDELKADKDFISNALLKMNDSPQLWEYYLLNFLSLFYSHVTMCSELFTYFKDQTKMQCPSDTFGNKLVWLHYSFANTPRNVLSILTLLPVINADNIKFSSREVVELLKDQTATAEKIVDMFFDVLTNHARKFNDLETAKETLKKYRETFVEDQMTLLLDITLSPLFALKKNAIITYFEISLINTERANNFMTLVAEEIGNANVQEKYPPSYFVDKIVSVMTLNTECSDLETFLNHGKNMICIPSKNAVRTALQTIIQRLMSEDDGPNSAHNNWLYKLLRHGDAQSLMSKYCHPNDKLFTPCFLYQLFTIAAKRDIKLESEKEEVLPMPYFPFYYKQLQYEVTEVKRKNAMLLSLCFLKRLHVLSQSSTKQCGELILDCQELSERSSRSDQVEIQVLIHELIKSVAVNIDIGKPVIIDELNKVLNNASFREHNATMIVYQIWKKCRSFTKLRKLVASQYSVAKEITCLESIHDLYGQEEKYFERTKLIDLQSIFSHDVSKFEYIQKLFNDLLQIFESRTEHNNGVMINKLEQILQKRCGGAGDSEKQFFLLCLLFVIYEAFYCEKEQLTDLVDGLQLKLNNVLPMHSVSVCCLFVDGGKKGLKTFDDELQNSFANLIPSDDEKEMWQGVVMIVGAVLTTGDKSCHLWDHLFNPDELKFIPGATIPGTLEKSEGKVYEDLTEIKNDGFFISQQRYDYITRETTSTRETPMSLPCLYFIQFANFACLCVHFLLYCTKAQHNNFDGNTGHAREECWLGLKRSWRLMTTRLDITTEERLSLIENCVNAIIKAETFPKILDQTSLDGYESTFDKEIFRPSWKSVISKRESMRDEVLRLHPNSIQSQIINLERSYPVFADKHSFLTFVFCSTSFHQSGSTHYKLNRFLLMRPLLNAIALNLPTFIDFYQWLHHGLAKRYTRADVHNLSLSKLLSDLRETGEYHNIQKLLDQEEKIFAFTRMYKDALFSDKEMSTITNDTKLRDIISISQSGSFGILYYYIEQMIRVHNGFLNDVKWNSGEIDPKELVPFSSKPIQSVGDIGDLMDLIEQHCCVLPSCSNTSAIDDNTLIESVTSQVYDLRGIQTAIHAKYIAKMKVIKQPDSELSWVFKDEEESVTNLFIEHSVSLKKIEEGIPLAYRERLDQTFITNLEFRCHSLSYFSLLHIAMGLRIAALYLAKALKDERNDFRTRTQFERWSLPRFLKHYTGKNVDSSTIIRDVLYIDVQKLDLSQNTTLQELIMRDVVRALRVFVMWLENGMYEFSYFPITVKEDIKIKDSTWDSYVREARRTGKIRVVYDKIKIFRLQLSKCDSDIRKLATEKNVLTNPLIKCVPISLHESEIWACFPNITVSNYVKFSIQLRQTENQFFKTLSEDPDQMTKDTTTQWIDRVTENRIKEVLNVCVDQSASLLKKKELKDLTTEEVMNFIKSIDLDEHYIEEAKLSDVNGKTIIDLNDRSLMNMLDMRGEPLAYLQFKVSIMREYGHRSPSILAIRFPPMKAAKLFSDIDKDAVKTIRKYQIDGEMLLEICENDAMLRKLSGDPVGAKEIILSNLSS